jgi:hypothetical protein
MTYLAQQLAIWMIEFFISLLESLYNQGDGPRAEGDCYDN